MGIGISLGNLAGTVAREGGIGLISAAQIGFLEPDFEEKSVGSEFAGNRESITESKKYCARWNSRIQYYDCDEGL